MLWRKLCLASLLAAVGGCSGEFILTAPDVLALPGQTAPVVVRLQRREFWFHCPPVADAAITFRLAGQKVRCARTDRDGYAAVAFPAGDAPGVRTIDLRHQDTLGYTCQAAVAVHVLSPDAAAVVVDLDGLPAAGASAEGSAAAPAEAAAALERLRAGAQIVYAAEACGNPSAPARERLQQAHLPPGPVVRWDKQGRWYDRIRLRRARKSPLAALRERVPNLRWAVARDALAAKRFAEAGLEVLFVGKAGGAGRARVFASWDDLRLPSAPPAE